MARLKRAFFTREAEVVAQELLGKILVLRRRHQTYRVRIVETEAYVGEHDLACHASKGRTRRTEVMFAKGGVAYVYFIYGMYEMFNVVTSAKNCGQAVLIRAGECLSHPELDISGPGKFTRELGITRALNGHSLVSSTLYFEEGTTRPQIIRARRIGVDYAKHWARRLLRFYDEKSSFVSRRV